MISGKLRHRISCYYPTLTSDGCGGFEERFDLRGTCWAEVVPTVPAQNEESLIDAHIKGVKFYKIKTRQNINFVFDEKDIIVFNGNILRIQGISNENERDFSFSLLAKSIGGDSVEFSNSIIFSQIGNYIFNQIGIGLYNQLGA